MIHAEEILKIKNKINRLYVKHTGQPLDFIGKRSQIAVHGAHGRRSWDRVGSVALGNAFWSFQVYHPRVWLLWALCDQSIFSENSMERDRFMSAEEAKTFGIVDHVLEHPPDPSEEASSEGKSSN